MPRWYNKDWKTKKGVHVVVWEQHNGPVPSGFVVDHIDGDKGNNDISNLRLATRSQNLMNAKKPKNNTTGFKGLSWDKTHGKFVGYVWADGKKHAKTGDMLTVVAWLLRKRKEIHGEFARFS